MKRCRICLCELSAHQSIGQWLWMTDVLCRDCRARFVRVKEPLQIQDLCVHALYRYDDFLEGLLFQFKEGRDIALAPIFFAPWMQWLERYRHHHWVLMPSSDEKCEERGFFSLREMLKQSGQVLYEPLYKRTNFKQSTRSGNERRQVMNEIEQKQEYPLPRGDLLLIDDIQFFANKERSQEEFFHTFNALLEGNQQIILTSDRYPKEINGVEDRLKSRFGWGLTVAIEPPELETRVAILMKKADENDIRLPGEVAFFIAKRLRSNVRELEGALNRVIANANFTGRAITIDFVREALRDLLALQEKLVTIDNIQKTVAEYYKIKVADLLSKRRSRSVARPRQMAMALAKELTNHSLPEIGDAFGGRDHTTVLHACRKIEQLREESHDIKEDFSNLIRTLSS